MAIEAKEIFEANSKSVRDLLCENGLGLYIPAYQRPFGWDKEKVNKLIFDTFHGYIGLSRSDESFTFLGTVITIHDINYTTVQPGSREYVPAKLLNVIDGQQRLTTLLLFCIALHNQISVLHHKYFKGKKSENFKEYEVWLESRSKTVLGELEPTFVERRKNGDSPLYPRMIRCFDDQWSERKLNAKYHSPIARLIFDYASRRDDEKTKEYKVTKRKGTIEGEEALCERFHQITKILKTLGEDNDEDEFEDLPKLKQIAQDYKFQRALINHDFPKEVVADLTESTVTPEYADLLQLILLANYLLTRVALTVVRGKNEDYAFTIFESLNTTGEPLTAFETFKPQVVMAEGLEHYENSKSRDHLNHITDYLSTFKVGDPLQKATRELIITFASNETGNNLPKRLADQRRYLKEEFDRHKNDPIQRDLFVKNFRDVADFRKFAWDFQDDNFSLHGLPIEASSNVVKLCLFFLSALNHSITVGPIIRFYSAALSAPDHERTQKIKDFEDSIKAITAFSTLWRASRRGTKNIDRQYREILSGSNDKTSKAPPLARTSREGESSVLAETLAPVVNVAILKSELRARLVHKDFGDLQTKDDFINQASVVPSYTNNRTLSRFLLLAAYHDAVADPEANGLIVKGKSAVLPCLTYEGFKDERNLTLEHVAPQDSSATGWSSKLYVDKELVHRIGNLVLVPDVANASFSARPWAQKRVLYKVLGAVSNEAATKILDDAKNFDAIEFGDSTQELLSRSKHLPQLSAIGDRTEDWSPEFIDLRSKRLLGLAYDELIKWLN